MRARTISILALAVMLAAPTAIAAPAPAPKARPGGRVVLDRVVAVVNDDIVLRSELDRATARHPLLREALSQLPANATQVQIDTQTRQVQIEVLDELIHLVLVRAEATKFDIKVSEQELQHALGNIAAQNGLTLDELKKQVEASEEFESWAEYSGELKEQLLGLRVSQMLATWSVSEAQIREYYRKMTKDESAKVVLEQFTFAPKSAERADRDQAFAAAQAAGRRLREGETGESLAKELGRDEEEWQRTVGRGDIAPALEDAVFAAKKGAVVGPLASGQGYVVYRVVELLESAALGFEQAKDRIRDQLENEAYLKAETDLREQLRAKAHVDVRL
ncbi:MAG: peptidyl-prolyl cis-trans isomerase [Deltaproteobacteria bacterium]|nr:peptidyl-prolyl cis-trans isomerase [Nannocystaceae bacterium]